MCSLNLRSFTGKTERIWRTELSDSMASSRRSGSTLRATVQWRRSAATTPRVGFFEDALASRDMQHGLRVIHPREDAAFEQDASEPRFHRMPGLDHAQVIMLALKEVASMIKRLDFMLRHAGNLGEAITLTQPVANPPGDQLRERDPANTKAHCDRWSGPGDVRQCHTFGQFSPREKDRHRPARPEPPAHTHGYPCAQTMSADARPATPRHSNRPKKLSRPAVKA